MFPKRIVVIGASSCEGKVDPVRGGFVGRLRTWHESFDQHNHVYNLGISGDTSLGIAERLTNEAQVRKPDLILFQGGLNDIIRVGSVTREPQVSVETSVNNLKNVIQQARQVAREVLWVSVSPIDETKTCPVSWRNIYYQFADAASFAQTSQNIAQELNVPYVDVFNKWLNSDYKRHLHSDGLHPNATGHEAIFQMIKAKLIELYGSPN